MSTHQRPAQPQHQHSRSRTFSFHSQKSHKSSGSKDLHETSAEKEAKRLHSKADPTLAISEAEPATLAAMKTEMAYTPLRSIQHKDAFGNAIADPDKSNPTRNRWERPLDTIRSFEAAIDGGYARKSLYGGNDGDSNWNRRSSTMSSGNQPRYAYDGYYNNRPVSFRPEHTQFDLGPRQSYYNDPQQYANNYSNGPNRQRVSRTQTDPQYQNYGRNQGVYPMPHKDRSYETVTSAAGSGNSEQAGYQTDPTSSDNSSIDRTMPAKRQPNDYRPGQSQPYQRGYLAPGANGQGRPQPQRAPASAPSAPVQQPAAPPPPPQGKQKNTLLRRTSTQQQQQQQPAPEKRKSWFARRFSKNS